MVVYGFGSAAVDFRIRTADFGDLYKDKLLAQDWAEMGGGAISNLLTQVSRLGLSACFLGKLGDDILGRKIVALLEEEKVDCSRILFSKDVCSPFNVAVYSGEEMRRRGGFLIPNSLSSLTEKDISKLAAPVKKGDFVMIEIGEIPPEQVLMFLRKVHKAGATVCVDVDLDPVRQCGFTPETFDEVFRLSDVLIPNVVAMSSIYPEETAESLAEKVYGIYRKPVIVSAGKDGAYYCESENGAENLPVYDHGEVKDTVGAGDAFHGGVVYGLASGLTLRESVLCGVICGGINCTAFGARTAMTDERTLRRIFKEVR